MGLSKIVMCLLLATTLIKSYENYQIKPSKLLELYGDIVSGVLAKSLEQVNPEDFYLTNITRIVWYITATLAHKGLKVQMKAMLRDRLDEEEYSYINYLHMYLDDEPL